MVGFDVWEEAWGGRGVGIRGNEHDEPVRPVQNNKAHPGNGGNDGNGLMGGVH